MRRFLLAAIALTLAAGFSPAAGAAQLTDIPTRATDDLAEFWGDVMVEFYGPYDKSRKCWAGTVDGARYCMRPHRLDAADADGKTRYFIVTGGYKLNADGGRDDCHACPGALGLIVLQPSDENLELVARNTLVQEAGAWGGIPGEESFRLREIGEGRHGWTMETGWTGQGYTLGSTVVFGLSGSDVVELGDIPDHTDNSGVCGEGMPNDCFVKSYETVFAAAAGGPHYDIVLRKRDESTEGPASFRIPFDADSLYYDVPDEADAFFGG